MFELPEVVTLTRQINTVLPGKTVATGSLGNREHKFVSYNQTPEEFRKLTAGRRIGQAHSEGKWLFVPLEPGHVLVLGEFGGRLLFHAAGSAEPKAYHLLIRFADGSALSAMTQMWSAMELYEAGQERGRMYIRDMRPTPIDRDFTREYFGRLIDELATGPTRSVKSLLCQDQLVPGLGNSIAQDIMRAARLHPRHPIQRLEEDQRTALYDAICSTVAEAIDGGGRSDEVDLFGQAGGYARVMDRQAVGRPCPACATPIEKLAYLGGACHVCPTCQV